LHQYRDFSAEIVEVTGVLVHENAETALIIDLDELLTAIGSYKYVSSTITESPGDAKHTV
jgi:hypothetical protein